jgi:hypothetical protein
VNVCVIVSGKMTVSNVNNLKKKLVIKRFISTARPLLNIKCQK